MSRGVCLILSIIFEEKKGDHWGHATEVQWKVLLWLTGTAETHSLEAQLPMFSS